MGEDMTQVELIREMYKMQTEMNERMATIEGDIREIKNDNKRLETDLNECKVRINTLEDAPGKTALDVWKKIAIIAITAVVSSAVSFLIGRFGGK